MKHFFGDDLLLNNPSSQMIYNHIKTLPIVDYHCHLDPEIIYKNPYINDIGELWMAGDHYKWRAMRLNGIDEKYITGDASYKEKFLKYASIMPSLAGNPLYYWSHLELKNIFDINVPLNKDTAELIYEKANKKAKTLRIRDLFKLFKVEYVTTTDDPTSELIYHGKYENTYVIPTFRADPILNINDEYIAKLSKVSNVEINSLDDLLIAINNRLDFFVNKGCVIADQSFEFFPSIYPSIEEARNIFNRRNNWNDLDKESFLGFILVYLAKEYKKRDMTMQLHFAVTRNVNKLAFKKCGVDSGFDITSTQANIKNVIMFLNQFLEGEQPDTILYSLNDSNLTEIACLTGAFKNLRIGAAWWFNDTVLGIKRNLQTIAEYSSLGNNLGMLTDSRSFASYVRFDLFRRILASYIGELVENGEYDISAALTLAQNISYGNAKKMISKEK